MRSYCRDTWSKKQGMGLENHESANWGTQQIKENRKKRIMIRRKPPHAGEKVEGGQNCENANRSLDPTSARSPGEDHNVASNQARNNGADPRQRQTPGSAHGPG